MNHLKPAQTVYTYGFVKHTVLEIQGVHALLIRDTDIGKKRRFVKQRINSLDVFHNGRLRKLNDFGRVDI